MEVELMKKNKAMEAEAPFKPNSFLPKTLNSNKNVYGLDVEINKVFFFSIPRNLKNKPNSIYTNMKLPSDLQAL